MDIHDRPATPGRARTVLLALALALALAAAGTACSGDGDDQRADTESLDSGEPIADDDPDDATTDDDDAEPGEVEVAGDGEILGSARADLRDNTSDNQSVPLRIDVTRLERHGDLVELTLLLTNEAEPPTDGSDSLDFSADVLFGSGYVADRRYDASGIGLIDGDAQKLYLPVLDADGTCLCTGGFGASVVPPGNSQSINATFGGVPDDVEKLDVSVPSFPVITEVPVG